jgi:hypothetical protein
MPYDQIQPPLRLVRRKEMKTLQGTREQVQFIDRQPFKNYDQVVQFCGTKKLAKQLLVDMGDALCESDRARQKGDFDDSVFELMFWNGTLFLTPDDQYDYELTTEDQLHEQSHVTAYDSQLDATFFLGKTVCGRKFVAVSYSHKEKEFGIRDRVRRSPPITLGDFAAIWWLEK